MEVAIEDEPGIVEERLYISGDNSIWKIFMKAIHKPFVYV